MAKKKPLFDVPEFVKDVDVEKLVHQVGSNFDFKTLRELKPYVRLLNKPKTKDLKSKDGADLNTGEMGVPVELKMDAGWTLNYFPPQDGGKIASSVEVSMGYLAEQDAGGATGSSHERTVFYAAIELVDFLFNQGWKGFHLEEGTDALSWAIWAYLKNHGKKLGGYKPTEFDEMRFENTSHLFEEAADLTFDASPRHGNLGQRGAIDYMPDEMLTVISTEEGEKIPDESEASNDEK